MKRMLIGHGGKCVPCRLILSASSNGKAANNTKKIDKKVRQEDNWKAVTNMKHNIMKSQNNICICDNNSN